MDSEIERMIGEIKADKSHGSVQLAARGIELLARACGVFSGASSGDALPQIANLVRRIRSLRPSMAAPGNWALIFYTELRERLRANAEGTLETAGGEIAASLLDRLDANAERMAEAAKPLLRKATGIMTLSYSSSIERVILTASPPSCRITVAESRPLLEGRNMLRRLREGGREVRCITDAEIGLFMREADILLLGADTVCSDLAVVNKTGSFPAALAARHFEKPCTAAADTFKISGLISSEKIVLEEGPGEEIWEEESAISTNVYFESVPAGLITCYLTEKGILSHHQIREEAARWKRVWEAAPDTL